MPDLRFALRELTNHREPVAAQATILSCTALSKNFTRITAQSDDLVCYTNPQPADALEIFVHQGSAELPELITDVTGQIAPADPAQTLLRQLTVAHFEPDTGQFSVDLVRHRGVLADWVAQLKPGQDFYLRGMHAEYSFAPQVDHHLLVADAAAIPAVASIVRHLPHNQSATAVLTVDDPADQHLVPHRPGVNIHWVTPGAGAGREHPLVQTLAQLPRPHGRVQAWVRVESFLVRSLRQLLLTDWKVALGDVSLGAYWLASAGQVVPHPDNPKPMLPLAAEIEAMAELAAWADEDDTLRIRNGNRREMSLLNSPSIEELLQHVSPE